MECEICGAAGASIKVEIDGSELVVCENCASLGEKTAELKTGEDEMEMSTDSSPSSPSFSLERNEVLKRDYGGIVKETREEKDLVMKELAERLKEKKSVVRRIENGKLKPDEELSEKLERELGVELFTERKGEHAKSDSGKESLTIGDVVKVK